MFHSNLLHQFKTRDRKRTDLISLIYVQRYCVGLLTQYSDPSLSVLGKAFKLQDKLLQSEKYIEHGNVYNR